MLFGHFLLLLCIDQASRLSLIAAIHFVSFGRLAPSDSLW